MTAARGTRSAWQDVLAADRWARDRARELTGKRATPRPEAMDVAYGEGESAG